MTNLLYKLPALPDTFRLGKCKRLKTDDISSVFNFNHPVNGHFLRILYKPCPPLSSGFAIIISKKTARYAVERNYCKRVVRELFRARQHQLKNLELVILVRAKFQKPQFETIAHEFDLLLLKISQRTGSI